MIDEIVTTSYRAVTRPFETSMGALSKAANMGANAVRSVTSALNPLNMAIGAVGIGALIGKVIQLNNQFQNTQRTIAGTLTALNVVGGDIQSRIDQVLANGADNAGDMVAELNLEKFQTGLRAAERTMMAINNAAASLPGEAEEYVSVFTTALPDVQAAIGNNVQQIYTFTNRLTAVGRTFGIDAAQIGADARRLFGARGGAGADVATFNRLLPFLRSVQGQAALTAETFNKMTNVERIELFRKGMEKLGPMLDNASNSWDAQLGALTSTANMVIRLGGAPLFDNLTNSVKNLNTMFVDMDGNLTEIGETAVAVGRVISNAIGGAFQQVGRIVETISHSVGDVMDTLDGLGVLDNLLGSVGNIMGAAQNVPSMLSTVAGGSTGGAGEAGATDAFTQAITDVSSMLYTLSEAIQPTMTAVSQVGGLLYDLGTVALPMFTGILDTVVGVLVPFWSSLASAVGVLAEKVRPGFLALWRGVSSFLQGVVSVWAPLARVFARVVGWIAEKIASALGPAISWLTEKLGMLTEFLGTMLRKLGEWLETLVGDFETPPENRAPSSGENPLAAELARMRAEAARNEAGSGSGGTGASATAPGARGGGGRVTQDMRFSRFEITQKFAEGYDPDRIAVAFAREVGRAGTERLQSGFEPAFTSV